MKAREVPQTKAVMKITIKTLQNKRHSLEVADGDSVADIKKRIESELKLGDADSQKLIHHGKILKDEQSAKDAGFKEGDFVVVMIKKARKKKKPKPAPQPAAPPTAPAATAATGAAAAPATNATGAATG